MASMRTLIPIDYPTSDGQPMAETPLHMRVMWDLIQTLIAWFVSDSMVYVWGNMFLYYEEGDPRKSVSPDVMVIKGVPKDKFRDTFKVWEEGGKTPNAIIEVTSKGTSENDEVDKFYLYQDVLRVEEYFLFDPRAEYLKPPLKGFRLVKGKYQPIKAVAGRLPSKVLGLHLERNGQELRFYDPQSGVWLPTPAEVRTRAEADRAEAAEARTKAEAEVERLRRELESLRRQQKKS
jgi:Uma2 family endonuclease